MLGKIVDNSGSDTIDEVINIIQREDFSIAVLIIM